MDWFPKPPRGTHESVTGTLVRMAVGAAAGAVLYKLGHPTIAIVAWSITGVVGVLSLASSRTREGLAKALAWFGRAVGAVVGNVLLTLVFVFAIVPARFVKWLSRADDLRLRHENLPSYYEPCDPADHKARYAGAMFATEVHKQRGSRFLVSLVAGLFLLAVAEGVLRLEGFGPGAVVYEIDAFAGYYPAPNQNHMRYGGRVQTNRFGMRAPEYAEQKPDGTFRILMLGDSTLWGGSYCDQDELYARLLERKLNELGHGKVEVLNMGTNGWGPFHERGYVDRYGAFGADLVTIMMPYDDIDRDKYSLMSLPFFRKGKEPRLALEEVVMHLMWRFRRDRIGYSEPFLEVQRELGTNEYGRLINYLQTGDPGITKVVRKPLTPVGGAEVMLHVLPSDDVGFGGEPTALEAATVKEFRERFGPTGVTVTYPIGLFKGKAERPEAYHDAAHLNPKGHAIYADFLIENITSSSARFKEWQAKKHAAKAP